MYIHKKRNNGIKICYYDKIRGLKNNKNSEQKLTAVKIYLKTLVQIESDCTLRLGLSSLIKKTFRIRGSQTCLYISLKQ